MGRIIGFPKSEVWRNRLKATYDPVDAPAECLSDIYKCRQYVMKLNCVFTDGVSWNQKDMCEVVLALIVEAFGRKKPKPIPGQINKIPEVVNKSRLYYYMKDKTNIVLDPLNQLSLDGDCSPTLSAIRLFFTPWALDPGMMEGIRIFRFIHAQALVFWRHYRPFERSHRSGLSYHYLFAIQKFFQFLLLTDGELLADNYALLPAWSRPPTWEKRLVSGTKRLKPNWIGAWASGTPDGRPPTEIVSRKYYTYKLRLPIDFISIQFDFDKVDHFQDIAMPPVEFSNPTQYGNENSDHFFQPKIIQFTGKGVDSGCKFVIQGFLHQFPDQGGIPGWQRITFVKVHLDPLGLIDHSQSWHYEGVVIPGDGNIIGRWCCDPHASHPYDSQFGPFILWNIDGIEDPNDEFINHKDIVSQCYYGRTQLMALARLKDATDAVAQAETNLLTVQANAQAAILHASEALNNAKAAVDSATAYVAALDSISAT
ncbi:MAG: hypothetical protein M1829_003916 [Trizodia sp. TS-e1964]|nr:MAG: hypothetical protein M1829_003916 [Trizodia sp. TS-e1964]